MSHYLNQWWPRVLSHSKRCEVYDAIWPTKNIRNFILHGDLEGNLDFIPWCRHDVSSNNWRLVCLIFSFKVFIIVPLHHLTFLRYRLMLICYTKCSSKADANSSPFEQNGQHFADDIFKCSFMNKKFCILILISPKFVPKSPSDNKPLLVQLMAWRRTGDKPLPEPILTQFTDAYMYKR